MRFAGCLTVPSLLGVVVVGCKKVSGSSSGDGISGDDQISYPRSLGWQVGEVSSIKELPTAGTVRLVVKDGPRLGSIPLPASAGGSRQSLLLGLDKILQKQELAAVFQSRARPQADNPRDF